MKLDYELRINAPVDFVFKYLKTISNHSKFASMVEDARQMTDGELSIGSRFVLIVKFLEQEFSLLNEVTDLIENRLIVTKSISDNVAMTRSFLLQEEEGITKVRLFMQTNPLGLFKLATPFMESNLRTTIIDGMDHLKQLLEWKSEDEWQFGNFAA